MKKDLRNLKSNAAIGLTGEEVARKSIVIYRMMNRQHFVRSYLLFLAQIKRLARFLKDFYEISEQKICKFMNYLNISVLAINKCREQNQNSICEINQKVERLIKYNKKLQSPKKYFNTI